MTLQKLADLAGVSVSTVSKAFSDSREISSETKEAIFKLAKKYNCFDKYNKKKYEEKVIAVICPEIRSAYYANIVSEIEKAVSSYGGTTVLSVTDFNPKTMMKLIRYYSWFGHADGIITIGKIPVTIPHSDIPIVAIEPGQVHKNIDSILIDLGESIDDAVLHFKKNGHRKIAFIGEALTTNKELLFKEAMKKLNLNIDENYVVVSSKRFEEAGYDGIKKLLMLDQIPTAILTAYDYIAFGAIQALQEHGFKIPDDISIIGMNDISFTSYINPPLTSVQLHIQELCNISTNLIFNKIQNKFYKAKQTIVIQSKLVIRKSVKDIR